MCARFTVLSDTPIVAAIAGCVIPLSRNSTIWMRWRCGADIFHRNAVFSRRTSVLLHLTICSPRIRWRKRITPRGRKTLAKPPDSSRYGGGIISGFSVVLVREHGGNAQNDPVHRRRPRDRGADCRRARRAWLRSQRGSCRPDGARRDSEEQAPPPAVLYQHAATVWIRNAGTAACDRAPV